MTAVSQIRFFLDFEGQSGNCRGRFHRFLAYYQFCTGQGYLFLITLERLEYKGMKVVTQFFWTNLDQA